jgi:alkyl sulfatase BDS1-like metallo-beta-lactamase superfamily hydrolase
MLAVWLPDRRVAITGDNVLKSFPNVSPIRGARFRSPEAWISSIDAVLALRPAALVPGHMRPLLTQDEAAEVLTAYRNGIESVLDQTMAGLAQGARPDELAAAVRLPYELAGRPWLQEFYGSVEWMVRGIYADRIGWFDGNASTLFPLPAKERAVRFVAAMGGIEPVRAVAEKALAAGDWRWAAELCDMLLAINADDRSAKAVKAESLAMLASRQVNAIARNYYLTVAQQLRRDAVSAKP